MKIISEYTLHCGEKIAVGKGRDESLGRAAVVNVHDVVRTKFYGFGAALTEAAAYTYAQMSEENKKRYLEMIFGKSGLDYRICRICIGSSDFSLGDHVYISEGDETLETFDLGIDKDYVIPMARDVLSYRSGDVKFFASPWSPPAFMKDSHSRIGGRLLPEYYGLYAGYICRFVEEYAKEGIKISAVTPQNEPENGKGWETCLYSTEEEAAYIRVLRKTLREKGLDTRILCWDQNRHRMFDRAVGIYERCSDDVDGLAFHWYSGGGCFEDIPLLRELYPDKVIIESEFTNSDKNYFGRYTDELRDVISAGVNAVTEWNALLNEKGMPAHNRDWGCISPLHYDRGRSELYKSVNYDEIFMFSHFIDAGSEILRTSVTDRAIKTAAVKNPDGSYVTEISNLGDTDKNVCLRLGGTEISIVLPGKTDTSLVIRADD